MKPVVVWDGLRLLFICLSMQALTGRLSKIVQLLYSLHIPSGGTWSLPPELTELLEGCECAAKEYRLNLELALERGQPPERIVRTAQDVQIDLTVIGSKGAVSGRKRGVGSTVEHVVLSVQSWLPSETQSLSASSSL